MEYAGHTLLTSLNLLDPKPEGAPLVGLWSLTQMPHQGELFIPTYAKAEPRIYFGLVDTPADELAMSDRLVRFKMRAAGEHKIGVRAALTTGRIGYLYPTGNRHALIVRNFYVDPSGEYADVPWTEPDDRGYSTQACSVNSRWGEFSEMEYHVPAIGRNTTVCIRQKIARNFGPFAGRKKIFRRSHGRYCPTRSSDGRGRVGATLVAAGESKRELAGTPSQVNVRSLFYLNYERATRQSFLQADFWPGIPSGLPVTREFAVGAMGLGPARAA